ncbi:MAG: hypothetical protein ACOYMZ_00005, partial [Minisyncoccia bacterium]
MEINSNPSAHRPEDNPGSLELPGFLFYLIQLVEKIKIKSESFKPEKVLEVEGTPFFTHPFYVLEYTQ